MNEEIIVAVYDTDAHADAAVRDLEAAHVPPDATSRHNGTGSRLDQPHKRDPNAANGTPKDLISRLQSGRGAAHLG